MGSECKVSKIGILKRRKGVTKVWWGEEEIVKRGGLRSSSSTSAGFFISQRRHFGFYSKWYGKLLEGGDLI